MANIEINNIISIVIDILGEPRRECDTNQWWEFNCRNCSDIDGVESDGKYNLCVNFEYGTYHCWKCQEKGRLSKLIRTYGGEKKLREYYEEVKSLRNARKYCLDDSEGICSDIIIEEAELELPDGFVDDVKKNSVAYKYLTDRGLNDFIIKKFNIGCTGWCKDFRYRNRIVVPSYDSIGELNYWVARDFSGKAKMKYCNPDVEKKKFIFNELLVNWYEDVTLVEGVFDHMVVPNSIPLLGKVIDTDCAVYTALKEKAMANINVFLDDDATSDAMKMYKFLNQGNLRGRVRLIECPQGYDASLVFQKFGRRGIIKLMTQSREINEFDLLYI